MRCCVRALLVVLGVAACASGSARSEDAPSPRSEPTATVECQAVCALEWERVEEWISRHTRLAVQTANDTRIETVPLKRKYPIYTFSATRMLDSAGGGTIRVIIGCGNRLGCRPETARVQGALLQFVRTGVDSLPPQSRFAGIRD